MADHRSPDDATATADEAALSCLNAAQAPSPDATLLPKDPAEEAARTPSPAEVVLLHEDRAEEWHFDEAIHKSRIAENRALSEAFKQRELHAKENHNSHLQGHEQQIAELLASAEAEERRCALELAALREELVEAQHQIDDLEDDCQQQVVAFDHEMRAERQRRASMEEELVKEKDSVLRATQHITEIEDREGQLMREKRARMSENRSACREQCREVQQSGDREIQEIGRALREEVDVIQKQSDEIMKETQRGVDAWVKRRQNITVEVERDINEAVDTKVYQGLAAVSMQVLEARELSIGQIKEVQARDFEHEKVLRERIGSALVSVDCSLQERDQMVMLEKSRKKQLATAADVLGCGQPTNRYSLNDTRRLRNAGANAIGKA